MALVAHRMMLPARHRRIQQQVAHNKVGVLAVPTLADYYCREGGDQQQSQSQLQLQLQSSQLELQASDAKVSATSCSSNHTHCMPTNGDWANQDKLANIWHRLEPAAFVEVHSIYNPIQLLTMEPDHKRVDLVVSEIIRQAAMEHEIKKQQWFVEAKEKNELSIKSTHLRESTNNILYK
ncbi:hypothetical protein ACLKA7_002223 [Drosophila subpalustris]